MFQKLAWVEELYSLYIINKKNSVYFLNWQKGLHTPNDRLTLHLQQIFDREIFTSHRTFALILDRLFNKSLLKQQATRL